jgi:hypothetical protein
MKKSNKNIIYALVGIFALAASSMATAQCNPPEWWPGWLPYYCQVD